MKATNEQIADLRANTIKVAHVYQIAPVNIALLISILDELLELRAKGEAKFNRECTCTFGPMNPHEYGVGDCEYADHHCDSCHENKRCTDAGCGMVTIADPVTVGGGG